MDKYNIYKDIATRTDGDIFIGVVGPVRTGKSTFITKLFIMIFNTSEKRIILIVLCFQIESFVTL